MKTNENQKTTSHQPGTQKPFFGSSPEHTFFSTQRAGSTPFFQAKADLPLAIQAKSATSDAEGISEEEVQRMPAFESEVSTNGEVQRKQINSPQHSSAQPIQAKLTIGEPGDKYEQEADRVASLVVEQINAPAPTQSTPGLSVQRQEENKEELQSKPEMTAQLSEEEKPEEMQTLHVIRSLQHLEEKPESHQAKSLNQQGEAIGGGEASTDLASVIESARGGGQPLDAGLQRSMGQAMGADFSGVRVHTDAQADQLNRSIQAKAFTTGQDVFFRQGTYEPGSRGGQSLIAHELTHVVQQNRGVEQANGTNAGNQMSRSYEKSSVGSGVIQRIRKARQWELIRVVGYSRWQDRKVTGRSGENPAYNQSLVKSVYIGAKRGDARGAGQFYNAVEAAREQLGGLRSPWSCAEVNAVAQLIREGEDVQGITLGRPYGEDGKDVYYCAACDEWMSRLGIYRR
ncbi:MAG: DUF4157 domain-containing protein [Trichormus sp.]